jgi:hypothetical protein
MNNQIITIESMEADHQTWLAAHAHWKQDLEHWKAEHESAVARLAEIQRLVREHGKAIEDHDQALRKAEEAVAAHELEIAEHRAGRGKKPQDVLANRHREQEGVFNRQLDAHERVKKHHEAVMTQIQALESSAIAAM